MFLGPRESASNGISVQQFCTHCSKDFQCFSNAQTLPLPSRGSEPHLVNGFMGTPESAPKRHLDRFSRFCRSHERDQLIHRQTQTDRQTHKHTDRPRYSVCSNSPHLTQCKRCGLKNEKCGKQLLKLTVTSATFWEDVTLFPDLHLRLDGQWKQLVDTLREYRSTDHTSWSLVVSV